ncbi:serine/threonine-protein kinase [Nocardia sp. CDC160]|uniref:serine/threonine-protein kinase n=1 Tax=Nocardia sp. CDC160 TaxID=3112166 RepID=UPI002DB916F4|nr:serine/threonine-protein kinase [Nocardia sp. CDC160]MEC3916833.1 serine/threonine-protein kinase [Nocardia sp. CDC160]
MTGASVMRLDPGADFAGYRIERVLGAGGMGVVYLARHPRLDRDVALKVFGTAVGGAHPLDSRGRARFDREAALAARLEHPDIVPIYDRSAPEDEIPWLCMRYINGGDIGELLAAAGGRLRAQDAVRFITDAGSALDYAHRRGVLHRDVKPANILVDRSDRADGRAALTDFGIARAFDDTLTLTGTTATVAYAAPERFGETPADHRADIYSLGCTFFEILTGSTPFPRPDQAAVISAHLTAPPPRPSELVPDLPPGLDEVIEIAMAKDPGDRYPDCATFAAAARRALDTPARPGPADSPRNPHSDTTVRSTQLPRIARPRLAREGVTPGLRERFPDFITLLGGLLSIIGAVLIGSGLTAPFVHYNEADQDLDSVVYVGHYALLSLVAAGWIAGSVAGFKVLFPALPREICAALIIGTAGAGAWCTALLLRLNRIWTHDGYNLVGDTIRGASGERLTVLGTGTLVLAGILAIAALMLGDSLPVRPRLPADAFSIATLLLSLLGCVAVSSISLPSEDVWHFLRHDYTWLLGSAATLSILPALTSFLHPRTVFRALTVGWAVGGLAVCLFLYSQGQTIADSGVAAGGNSAVAQTVLFGASLLGLIVVNAVALAKSGRPRV